MKRGQRASNELRQKVVAAHANGATVEALVKKYKVSSNSIYRWTAKANPKPKKGRRRKAQPSADPVNMMADSLLAAIRVPLVEGIRELVKLGVQHTVENMIATMQRRISGIVDVA